MYLTMHHLTMCSSSPLQSLMKLKHPNIIKVHEVFRENNRLHLVFEYMQQNLYELMEQWKNRWSLATVMSHTHIPPTCAFSVLHRPPWSLLLSLKATLISRAHGQKYSLPDTASSHLYASTWLVGDTVGIMVPSPPQPWSLFCLCGLLLLQL